uniref:Uncharacterized protein n=1 Tax=Zea mays TaxID=4577 RepID=A0A804LMJ3_MAIZE
MTSQNRTETSDTLHISSARVSRRTEPKAGASNGGRQRPEGARRVDEPVRDPGPHRAQPEGPGVRVRGGGPRQQERAPPGIQPGAQERAGAPPRRPRHKRVPGHPAVHRRGVGGDGAGRASGRPLRARGGAVLGRVHRRQGGVGVAGDAVQVRERGGEGGGGGARPRGARRAGGRVPGLLQGEAVLRRRRHRVRGRRSRRVPRLVRGRRQDHREQAHRPGPDAAAGRVGGPVPRRRRGQGRRARRPRQDARVPADPARYELRQVRVFRRMNVCRAVHDL